MNENGNRFPIIEALILSSPEPLEPGKITAVVDDIKLSEIDEIVRQSPRTMPDLSPSYLPGGKISASPGRLSRLYLLSPIASR